MLAAQVAAEGQLPAAAVKWLKVCRRESRCSGSGILQVRRLTVLVAV